MVQVIKMTPEEKKEMYMKVPHEELVSMKVESERLMEIMEAHISDLEKENYRLQSLLDKHNIKY